MFTFNLYVYAVRYVELRVAGEGSFEFLRGAGLGVMQGM